MRLLLVEDDPLQAEAILERLNRSFPEAQTLHVTTELEFRKRLDEIVDFAPDAAIIDVMLRWTDPSPEAAEEVVPEEVRREKHYRAGLRCHHLLADHPGSKNVQVIFYTVLERSDIDDLGGDVEHVPKTGALSLLMERIKDVVGRS